MASKVFTLSSPIELKGAKYSELTAREPKVRDLRNFLKNLDKDAASAIEKVMVDLCEVDPAVIAELAIADFADMKKWFEAFLKPMMDESDS